MKQIRKVTEKGKSTFWLKGFVWLFCIMILFTIISKVADSFSVAKVKVGHPSARKLQYTVSAEGKIEKNREISVLTQPDLLVKSVLVSEGQRVKKGDVLAQLDLNQLEEQLDSINGEKKALELQNQAAEKNKSLMRQKRKKALEQAKSDYRQLRKENKAALANARRNLARAKKELAEAEKKPAGEGKDLEQKEAVAEKKRALEELRAAADKEEKAAKRAIEEAQSEPEADNSIEVNNITIRSLQKQIDKLMKIKKQKGQIPAPEAGVITGVLVNVGQRTMDSGFFTMTDDSAGLKFVGQIAVSDAKYVAVGDKIVLKSADQKLEDISVNSLEMDESREFMNVTALLPADTFALGESVTMTAGQESENYPCTVPVTALRQESGRNFILTVQTENTVLGEQEVARRMEVTVLEKNESYVALEMGALDGESRIVIDSDKYVQTGDRIRIREEGDS